MSDPKDIGKFWQEPKLFSKLLGMGRKRYFVAGLMFITYMSSIAAISLLFELPNIAIDLIVAIALVGFLLNSIISLRLRYWRDVMLWRAVPSMTVVIEFFVVGFALIFKEGHFFAFVLACAGTLVSVFLAFRIEQRGANQLELARRKGFLKQYLDEKSWTYDDNPAKGNGFWYALQRARGEEKAKGLVRWLRRLEKLHYLIPGIAISFRRAFGNEEIILGILFITMGLVFVSVLLSSGFTYRKIREWEQERGKPILLRFVWEREQQEV